VATTPKTFSYELELDGNGKMTVGDAPAVEVPEAWMPDHLLLAAVLRCSIASLAFHAKRAGHNVAASGSAKGTVARRSSDGRFAFESIDLAIDVELTPPTTEPDGLFAKAERDCFVGASLTIKPAYEWHVS
jgi:organic hydroperoxide reductase OsmC/OhrA